ncbi:MAG TPA: DNA internalization-related competence protein ComEC/Rec2 [Longimicrobiales bacterium]|nr:DNA internalization-related competence protein ComEC/Rec2 [Longimicrobiales bacterium]
MVGVALAFCAGVALPLGGPAWCGALLAILVLLRPGLPFLRPATARVVLALLVLAGAAHGRGAVLEGPGEIPSAGGAPPPPAHAAGPNPAAEPPSHRDRIRDGLLARIGSTFPREAPMVEALLLAERGSLDREVRDAFTRTGAAHLLAISGFHVGILAGWVVLLLRALGLSRGRAALAGAAAVWGYIALLAFPTSAVRAGLLLSGAAVGRIRGRPVHPLGAWGTALLAVAVADPASLSRAGAQLSFAGALGLILWVDSWTRATVHGLDRLTGLHGTGRGKGRGRRWIRAVSGAVAASAAAQVATLPLAVWHFQRVAVLALPATLLATPLVSLALPGALLALVVSGLGIPGWRLLAGGVEGLLWATRAVMAGMALWDPGWLLGPGSVALATGAGVAAWALTHGRRPRRWRVGWAAAAVGAGLLAAPVAQGGLRPRGLEVRVMDVGQGDAIAVGTPEGRWFLVDTGAGSGERLGRELVGAGIPRLDLLVLTHPDLDHMGAAAALLRTLPVAGVADGGVIRGTGAYREVVAAAEERGVPWRVLRRGTAWEVDGVSFRVLHPGDGVGGADDPNDRSVVLLVSWGDFDVLLTGDISVGVEEEILPLLGPVEVLKVGHHGSRTSTGVPLLDRTRPLLSVISVGRGNRFGHPAPEVLARLREKGVRTLRTDQQGNVRILGRRDGSFTVFHEGNFPD